MSTYRLRSGLTILPSQQKELEARIAELAQQLPANFVLLTDITGQVIVARGEHDQINLVAVGSLLAGDLAASQEMARMLGEYEAQQLVLREGQTKNTFICEAGNYFALMVQVNQQVPLGWARMLIKKTANELPGLIEKVDEAEREAHLAESTPAFDDADLTDLFDDAIDELWME